MVRPSHLIMHSGDEITELLPAIKAAISNFARPNRESTVYYTDDSLLPENMKPLITEHA